MVWAVFLFALLAQRQNTTKKERAQRHALFRKKTLID
jgi:hypothetical protein